jgi:SOS-response transcriptional repressor LexA
MAAPIGAARTYPEGVIIYVDFEKKSPVNGQRIVAKIDGGSEVTFKVFKEEDGRRWLQPLNSMHQPIYDKFKALGTVIGTWIEE